MAKNVTPKLIAAHLVDGRMQPGEEIGIKIDQILTQDATGTMVMQVFTSYRSLPLYIFQNYIIKAPAAFIRDFLRKDSLQFKPESFHFGSPCHPRVPHF